MAFRIGFGVDGTMTWMDEDRRKPNATSVCGTFANVSFSTLICVCFFLFFSEAKHRSMTACPGFEHFANDLPLFHNGLSQSATNGFTLLGTLQLRVNLGFRVVSSASLPFHSIPIPPALFFTLHLEALAEVDVGSGEGLGLFLGVREVVLDSLAAFVRPAEQHLQIAVVGAHVQDREHLRSTASLDEALVVVGVGRGDGQLQNEQSNPNPNETRNPNP